jgi:hypothetical protein
VIPVADTGSSGLQRRSIVMKRRAKPVAPEFPKPDPDDEVKPGQVRLQKREWDRLKRIAASEKKSMNDVVAFFLKWAGDDYDLANARKSKK